LVRSIIRRAVAFRRHRGVAEFPVRTSRIVSGYVGGIPGVQAMWAGADWAWHKPVFRNQEIATEAWLKDLIEHDTKFADRAIQQIYHVYFFNPDGDLVAEADSWCFRTDRNLAREQGTKYTEVRARPQRIYTRDDLQRLYKHYEAKQIRGSTPRYWEDVAVGDVVPTMAKGPMTITGFIAFAQGWGGLISAPTSWLGVRSVIIPASGSDCPERVHWEPEFALMVGAPGAYDYGPERCSWLTHHLTNWMGDDGFLRRASCKIRRHNPEGDLLFIDGTVIRTFQEEGRHLVEIERYAHNQDGELSVLGSAIVELPSRSGV
jgi:hypothetical protein